MTSCWSPMHGIQLWVALPDATRRGPFEEEIVRWRNFIGRTHEKVAAARQE